MIKLPRDYTILCLYILAPKSVVDGAAANLATVATSQIVDNNIG